MIKNIILDVGRVLVAWQPSELMKTLGFSDETIEILTEALFASGVWNETDRGVLSDKAFLELAVSKAPEYEQEIRSVSRAYIRDFAELPDIELDEWKEEGK